MRDFLSRSYDLLLKGGAAAAGFFRGMAGGMDRSVALLAALMVADYVSGVAAAALGKSRKSSHGKLSSEAGGKGLIRKGLMLLVVCLAYGLDLLVNEGNNMFASAAVWFYIGNEGLSLLENLALAGVPIPKKLRGLLEKAAQEDEIQQSEAPQDNGDDSDGNG